MIKRAAFAAIAAVILAVMPSCASNPALPPAVAGAPRFPDYPLPEIPAALTASAALRARHEAAWKVLQSGNARRAAQDFASLLKQSPAFYPAEVGLGFAYLADRRYKDAEPRFAKGIVANGRYLPAWIGRSEALLGLKRDGEAIEALERVLVLDPKRDSTRARLDLLRFRQAQTFIDGARRASAAGRLDEAEKQLERALIESPQSAAILHELSSVELKARRFDEAEAHARRAAQLEPQEPAWHVALGDLLEARQKYRDAAAAYGRAVAIDPRPEWRARNLDLREKAEAALLPADFSKLPAASRVTRGEVAAFVAIHLDTLIARAPARATDVATDVRTHWAAPWIVPVTRAGVMSIYPNHTFQPGAIVARSELAAVVASLLRIAGANRRADLAKWQAARPKFADVPPSHVSYTAAALAVAAGAMNSDGDGRFYPTRPATGRELEVAVRRVDTVSAR